MATTDDMAQADVIVLNTCHIREKAAEKVYSELGRIKIVRNKRLRDGNDTTVVVAGCVAQAEGREILSRAPIVNIVIGPAELSSPARLYFFRRATQAAHC